jgi:hypothetical protein
LRGSAADLLRARCGAAGKRTEGVEIHRFGALGDEIGVEEVRVAQFVIGVIRDVLIHITIEIRDCGEIRRIVQHQFGVLLPEVCFEELGCGGETEDIHISTAEPAVPAIPVRPGGGGGRKSGSDGGAGDAERLQKRSAPGHSRRERDGRRRLLFLRN